MSSGVPVAKLRNVVGAHDAARKPSMFPIPSASHGTYSADARFATTFENDFTDSASSSTGTVIRRELARYIGRVPPAMFRFTRFPKSRQRPAAGTSASPSRSFSIAESPASG